MISILDLKFNIIVVDDEPTVLEALEAAISPAFNHRGFILDYCSSAEEVLELTEENRKRNIMPALVIADYKMPSMNGDTLLTLIEEQYPDAVKILLTGQIDTRSIANVINKANLYRYISKPWEKNDLLLTLNEALRHFESKLKLEKQARILEEQNRILESMNTEIENKNRDYNLALETSRTNIWKWNFRKRTIIIDNNRKGIIDIPTNREIDDELLLDRIHADDIEPVRKTVNRITSGIDESINTEFRVQALTGQYIWVEAAGNVIEKDKDGNPVLLTGIFHDINRIKEYEILLEESRTKYRLLYNNTPLAIVNGYFEFDIEDKVKDFIVEQLNDSATDMFAIVKENILEKSVFDFLGFYNSDFLDFFQNIFTSEAFRSVEIYSESYEKNLHITGFLYDKSGSKVVFFINDKTKQYEYERKTREAKEKAEESDRMKTAFLSNMSHEIRTPLNQIVGFSQLLRDDDLEKEEKNEYIDIVRSNSESLLELINNIIDISKIEANELVIVKSDVSVNDMLQDVCNKYKTLASFNYPERNLDISLKKALPDESAIINTDETRLAQLMSIFVDNAVKFTEKGSVEIGYKVENDTFILYVKDTGIGIKEEYVSSIFDAFKQLDHSYTRSFEGTGLGLSLAKSLSKLMNCTIELDSEYRKGSTFYVKFPFKKIEEETRISDNYSDIRNEQESLDSLLKGMKVLVVDDNSEVLLFFGTLLKHLGLEIVRANSAPEALRKCKSDPSIKIVLLDIQMHEMTGVEALPKLKEINRELYVIAQTAFAVSGEKKNFLSLGFDDYIPKPISKSLLIEKLQKAASKIQK